MLDDPHELLRRAERFLTEDEARHNLVLGLLSTIRDLPDVYPERRFWLVDDEGVPVAVALRTPPHHLVLARPRDPAVLAALAAAIDEDLPGVTGARPEADAFAAAWCARTGVRAEIQFEQRIYAVTHVRPPAPAPGGPREATAADRSLLLGWLRAFAQEALHQAEPDEEAHALLVDRRLTGGTSGLLLWEDRGEPVSVAGWGAETPRGIRIGPVYTPPERRRRGYASALVAELSTRLLAAGRRFCFLYTDLANPTSNRIYADVGYEPVCDSVQIGFAAGSRPPRGSRPRSR